MRRWRGAVVALAALLTVAVAACGGDGTAALPGGTPSAWVAAPGWVKLVAFSGTIGPGWSYGPYFNVGSGRVRVLGSLTSNDTSGYQWNVAFVPPKRSVAESGVAIAMQKTADNPAVSKGIYFEGMSEKPLAAGDYRFAVEGSPGTFSITVYVHGK